MMMRLVVWLVVIGVIAAGCSSSPGVHVTKEQLGDDWPLTVNEGTITYDRGVLFTSNGKTYAVNGTAMSNHPNLPRIEQIQLDDTAFPLKGAKVRKSVGPLIDMGLKLKKG